MSEPILPVGDVATVPGHRNSTQKTILPAGVFPSIEDVVKLGITFGTIYCDPPWRYGNQGTTGSTSTTEHKYAGTMSIAEICAMPIGQLASEKCHLHLWTTNAFLFECPRIFEAWGFEFKSTFVWVKDKMGIGNYWRNSHEILLLAIKGGQTAISHSEVSWSMLPRGDHSSKPDRIREKVERLSPGPRLELFGRSPVEGWCVMGNQISML